MPNLDQRSGDQNGEPLQLDFAQAAIWVIPLCVDDQRLAACESWLSRDELMRAERFVTADLRRRFVTSRGTLRELLGRFEGRPPESIEFEYEQWGKPQLKGGRERVQFNVSHSGDWALVGLCQQPIGVDLEVPNSRINPRAIASQVLSKRETATWEQLPAAQRELAIMQLWVCKEATLKALGLGIAEGLTKSAFELPLATETSFSPLYLDPSLQLHLDEDGTCRMNSWLEPQTWRVQFLTSELPASINTGSLAAVAVQRGTMNIAVNTKDFERYAK